MSDVRTGRGLLGHAYGAHEAALPPPLDDSLADAPITEATRLGMYKVLLEGRQLEERVQQLFLQNLVKGTTHLAIGQEAVAAGVGAALRPDDYSFATYRGHHHVLARGVPMGPLLAELMGRSGGLLGGKGGSMHLTSVEHGMLGCFAIVGAHLCIANGAAWSAQLRGSGQVTVAFFGDGTTNIGAFHEALNLAAVWSLPIVFVCENNQYGEYTALADATAVARPAADRAAAYGLEPIVVDGNDPDAVHLAAVDAVERARDGEGPSLLEALTYRHSGHSRADPASYRPDGELDAWLAHDPIPLYHRRLLGLGVAEARLAEVQLDVTRRVEEATEWAKASPPPDLASATKDLWADGGVAWRN